jgi:hypothetical protein
MRDLGGVRSYLIRKLKPTVNKVLSHAGQPVTNLRRFEKKVSFFFKKSSNYLEIQKIISTFGAQIQ